VIRVRLCPRGHVIDEANRVLITSRGRSHYSCLRCRVAQRAARNARETTERRAGSLVVVHGCGYCGVGSDRLTEGLCPDCVSVQAYIRKLDKQVERYATDPQRRERVKATATAWNAAHKDAA
jgi:hypothetical protein